MATSARPGAAVRIRPNELLTGKRHPVGVVVEHEDARPVGPGEAIPGSCQNALCTSLPGQRGPAHDAAIPAARQAEGEGLRRAKPLQQSCQLAER